MIPRAVLYAVTMLGAGTMFAAQPQEPAQPRPQREVQIRRMGMPGPALEIGVTVHDVEQTAANAQGPTGAVIDTVRSGSAAEKAGLKKDDIVVEFDGERIRSARQLGRVVSETAPDHPVTVAIMRDGHLKTMPVTPTRRDDSMAIDRDALRDQLPDIEELARMIPREIEMGPPGSGRRIGIEIQELSPQLASYFGAKHGVLVAAVNDGSAAAAAGVKAGDVVVSANGVDITERSGLRSALRGVKAGDEVTLGIVREKREMSVKVKVVGSQD